MPLPIHHSSSRRNDLLQVEAHQQFDHLKAFLKCYAPTCSIRLTLHSDSAKIPVTGLVCNSIPPGADGLLEWWCTWEQQ